MRLPVQVTRSAIYLIYNLRPCTVELNQVDFEHDAVVRSFLFAERQPHARRRTRCFVGAQSFQDYRLSVGLRSAVVTVSRLRVGHVVP